MRAIDQWLSEYGESHQNKTNKTIHWICVPAIMFSLIGLLWCIPFPGGYPNGWLNVGSIFIGLALLYYLRLSFPIFMGFVLIGGGIVVGNYYLHHADMLGMGYAASHAIISIAIFAIAWVGQFIGHNIEGKKPSFIKDLQFLLIGPAWLLHFVYKKLGIPY